MAWFFGPFVALWALIRPRSLKKAGCFRAKDESITKIGRKRRKRICFYAQIPTNQIRLYQAYIDRAFQLSPTLEFEKNDPRFHRLLSEAAHMDSLSQVDLELMRMQYVLADKRSRKAYRHRWALKVINRRENDFFPSPWAVLSALFVGHERQEGRSDYLRVSR
jgi:hypothetical protein